MFILIWNKSAFYSKQGALIGGIASTLLVGWISLGTQAAMIRGDIIVTPKAVSVAGCVENTTLSEFTPLSHNNVEFDRHVNNCGQQYCMLKICCRKYMCIYCTYICWKCVIYNIGNFIIILSTLIWTSPQLFLQISFL